MFITNRIQYKNIFVFLALFALLVISASPVMAAADEDALADSQFPKAQNDNQNTGQSQYVGPQSNNTTWNYSTGDENSYITGAPSIGPDGTVYLPTRFYNGTYYLANLYALTPDGTKKWNYTIYEGVTSYSYFTGSPAITQDGTIYVTGQFYGDTRDYGFLYALNPDGTLKWKYILNEGLSVYMYGSSPAVGSDGTIYFSSGYYQSGWYAKLNAVNPNGTSKWAYASSQGASGVNIASPAIASDGTIYFAYNYLSSNTYTIIHALDQNGNVKWTEQKVAYLIGFPAVASDGTIYLVTEDVLYALNPNGSEKWTHVPTRIFTTSPSIAKDGTIYIGGLYYFSDYDYGYMLYALNPADGSLKWNYTTDYRINYGVVIGADGTIYFSECKVPDTFFALNSDGTLKWSLPVEVTTSAAIGSNGYLYFGIMDGRNSLLYVVEASGSNPEPDNNDTNNTTVNAATTTTYGDSIGMQETGAPLSGMVLAILMVLSGFIGTRKN